MPYRTAVRYGTVPYAIVRHRTGTEPTDFPGVQAIAIRFTLLGNGRSEKSGGRVILFVRIKFVCRIIVKNNKDFFEFEFEFMLN